MTGRELFGRDKALIGMVHVQALPGTPRNHLTMDDIVDRAVNEARLLAKAGFDALILENMHDVPYLRREVGPEIVAAMTTVATEVRDLVSLPMGIQILAGANRAALAVAHAVGLQFIRAEGFVFAAVADEGILEEADAGPLLRYRRSLGAEGVAILCDLKKKHSAHAITGDISLGASAHGAEFFGADGVIVTGAATGASTHPGDVEEVHRATNLPVLVGSGVTPEAIPQLLTFADGLIVGSWLKEDGHWNKAIDPDRAIAMVEAMDAFRGA